MKQSVIGVNNTLVEFSIAENAKELVRYPQRKYDICEKSIFDFNLVTRVTSSVVEKFNYRFSTTLEVTKNVFNKILPFL